MRTGCCSGNDFLLTEWIIYFNAFAFQKLWGLFKDHSIVIRSLASLASRHFPSLRQPSDNSTSARDIVSPAPTVEFLVEKTSIGRSTVQPQVLLDPILLHSNERQAFSDYPKVKRLERQRQHSQWIRTFLDSRKTDQSGSGCRLGWKIDSGFCTPSSEALLGMLLLVVVPLLQFAFGFE